MEAFGRGGGGASVPGRYSYAPAASSAPTGMRRGAFDGVDPWNEF